MKKHLLKHWINIICVGLFMVSCNNDNPIDDNNKLEPNQLIVSAKLPNDFLSRSAIPNEHNLRCIFELWTKDETPRLVSHEEKLVDSVDKLIFDTKISSGSYSLVMWADYVDKDASSSEITVASNSDLTSYIHYADKYYDTSNLKSISVKDALQWVDSEVSDAFYYSGEILKQDGEGLETAIEMLRSLTKISIKEQNLREFGQVNRVEASYDAYTTFNAITGQREDAKESVNYLNADFHPENITDGTIISFCMFANNDDTTLGNMILKLNTEKNGEQIVNIPDIIPLKQGFHVKASASMLAESPSDFDIEFDINVDEWETENQDISASVIKAKVGDFFYADGTYSSIYVHSESNPVIGIVYAVAHDGGNASNDVVENYPGTSLTKVNGWVVALRDVVDGKQLIQPYKGETIDVNESPGSEMNDGSKKNDIKGFLNTKAIRDNANIDDFAIVKAISEYSKTVPAPANTSGWYWGGVKQYLDLSKEYANVTIVNKVVTEFEYLAVGKSLDLLSKKGLADHFSIDEEKQQFYFSSSVDKNGKAADKGKLYRVGLSTSGANYGGTAAWQCNDPRHARAILTF